MQVRVGDKRDRAEGESVEVEYWEGGGGPG